METPTSTEWNEFEQHFDAGSGSPRRGCGRAVITDLALADNKLGVVLRDPTLVRSLVEHFRRLIAPENALVRLA